MKSFQFIGAISLFLSICISCKVRTRESGVKAENENRPLQIGFSCNFLELTTLKAFKLVGDVATFERIGGVYPIKSFNINNGITGRGRGRHINDRFKLKPRRAYNISFEEPSPELGNVRISDTAVIRITGKSLPFNSLRLRLGITEFPSLLDYRKDTPTMYRATCNEIPYAPKQPQESNSAD